MPFINLENQLYGIGHLGYRLKETKGFAIDIKTKTNVTSFDRYLARDPNSIEYLDGDFLASKLNFSFTIGLFSFKFRFISFKFGRFSFKICFFSFKLTKIIS